MKKRNPIYSVGSFLLAGALTLSMAARHLPLQQHRLPQPHLPRKRPLPRRYPVRFP